MATNQYLDKAGLKKVLTKLKEKFASIDAIVFKDAVANIAALPALGDAKAGWMYTITGEDTTTADFKKLQDTIDDIKSTLGQNANAEVPAAEK